MMHHIWGMRSEKESMSRGALVTFDFSNAFPTLTHQFISAVLQLIHLPAHYITFIYIKYPDGTLPLLWEYVFRPEARIGQGDPFSPVLFSFCVSFVLYPLERVHRSLPFMYADNLSIIYPPSALGPFCGRYRSV